MAILGNRSSMDSFSLGFCQWNAGKGAELLWPLWEKKLGRNKSWKQRKGIWIARRRGVKMWYPSQVFLYLSPHNWLLASLSDFSQKEAATDREGRETEYWGSWLLGSKQKEAGKGRRYGSFRGKERGNNERWKDGMPPASSHLFVF